MPLVSLSELLSDAEQGRHGVGAFNVIQLEHAEAIVAGAVASAAPVVLQISENTITYHGSPTPDDRGNARCARVCRGDGPTIDRPSRFPDTSQSVDTVEL